MVILTLVRHGESQFNLENRFTGWLDAPLTQKGIEEATRAAERLKEAKIHFQKGYSSALSRASHSLLLMLKVMGQEDVPVNVSAELNERNYGDLQGLNKAEAAKQFGEEQVKLWRRSYRVAPPGGESLKDTAERTLPFFHSRIMADVRRGDNVLVVAHGNSLRSIAMDVEKLTEEQIVKLEIQTGMPIIYEFNHSMTLISKRELYERK